jgi:hypothetical protein
MYEEQSHNSHNEWASTAKLILLVVVILIGFMIAYIIGGKEWMKWYAIIFIPILSMFVGIYAIMSLMSARDLGMARAFGDILHAHSQSGAQQAKAVTEVIRGANAMNKADAYDQKAKMKHYGNIGAQYEKEIAKLRIAMVDQNVQMHALESGVQNNPNRMLDWDDDNEDDDDLSAWD